MKAMEIFIERIFFWKTQYPETNNKKKKSFSSSANSQYFFPKISGFVFFGFLVFQKKIPMKISLAFIWGIMDGFFIILEKTSSELICTWLYLKDSMFLKIVNFRHLGIEKKGDKIIFFQNLYIHIPDQINLLLL